MDNILQKIKKDGFRLTKIRKAMVGIFVGEKKPITSSEIQEGLSLVDIKADRTTVYRELLFLLERKIIKKIQFSDHKMYYEICSDHHHHLVCLKCNSVKEIVLEGHLERQEKDIYAKEKFKVLEHSLEFYGLCEKCI
ncbi:MAG: transcriptional repressor [Candidatus Moranbacteria bacterium]|nr:transcriptional repressor [Candidatus Moranbacteria bacterium]